MSKRAEHEGRCTECNGKGYIPYRDPKKNPVYGRDTCHVCKGTRRQPIMKEKKEPRYTKVFKEKKDVEE